MSHFERLEHRQLFSTASSAIVSFEVINGDTLMVHGAAMKDVMTIRPANGRIEVWEQRINESNNNAVLDPVPVKMFDTPAAPIAHIFVIANGGNDEIRIEHGLPEARLFGGSGNDKLHGGDGDDQLYGEDGDDHLWGHGGSDYMDGGTGADRFDGGTGPGFDTVTYSGRTNTVYVTYNSGPSVELYGGDDGESFEHDDIEDNVECVKGGLADDQLSAEGARDDYGHWLYGGNGNDTITCSKNNDVAFGGNGDDYIYGRDGNDFLYGENGSDHIYGEVGDDFLDGVDFTGIIGQYNHYTDYLDGGAGRDTARYGVTTSFFQSRSDDRVSNCEVLSAVRDTRDLSQPWP